MLVLPYIKNITEKIDLSIDKNEYLTGHRILNKLTGFIKKCIERSRERAHNLDDKKLKLNIFQI